MASTTFEGPARGVARPMKSIFNTVIDGITARGLIVGTQLDLQEALNFAREGQGKARSRRIRWTTSMTSSGACVTAKSRGRVVIDFLR
jgi:propanol-preferring alcohol dehydrogenase